MDWSSLGLGVTVDGSMDAGSNVGLRWVVSMKWLASHYAGQLIGEDGQVGPVTLSSTDQGQSSPSPSNFLQPEIKPL